MRRALAAGSRSLAQDLLLEVADIGAAGRTMAMPLEVEKPVTAFRIGFCQIRRPTGFRILSHYRD